MADLSCIPKFEKKAIADRWVGQNLKLMLLSKNHIPNAGTQQYVSDVVINEISDERDVYTAGGIVLEGKASTPDPLLPNNIFFDANDIVVGPGASVDYRFGLIYEDMGTGNHSVNPIRAQIDFLEDQKVTNGISTINWNALGIIYVS